MHKLGLKLWSTNRNYVEEAVQLFKNNAFQYIELYIVPGSYTEYIEMWLNTDIPFAIHAPHFRHGMNLARKDNFSKNLALADETLKFADMLKAEVIIFHPGIAGNIKETVFHLNLIDDNRIIVENKPYFALNDGLICNGISPEEIRYILENTNTGFCLDIGHAFCSANAQKVQPMKFLKEFISLNPKMYHLTDGEADGIYDRHYHFGQGNFDINEILELIPGNSLITIETIKNFRENLSDFDKDISYLRNCLERRYFV